MHVLVKTVDENICKDRQFCGTTLLPLEGPSGINSIVQPGICGSLIMEVPLIESEAPEFSGNNLVSFTVGDKKHVRKYGLFLWANRRFRRRTPQPINAEQVYMWWIKKYFKGTKVFPWTWMSFNTHFHECCLVATAYF